MSPNDIGRFVRNTSRAIFGGPLFVVQHGMRVSYMDRTTEEVERFAEPAPTVGTDSGADVQLSIDGCGPLVCRTYSVDIDDAQLSANALLDRFVTRPDDFAPQHVAAFARGCRSATHLAVADEFTIEIPGPWNGPVRVADLDDTSVSLVTLDGHMEAGHIRFQATDIGEHRLRFEVRSWARAGDEFFEHLHMTLRLAREAQTAMWVHTCDRAVEIADGKRSGPISVSTEILIGSEIDC